MSAPLTRDQRADLVQRSHVEPVTLDGQPAVVSGAGQPFARVRRRDGKGGDVEFAWATVERIINSHGRFAS